jgi:2-oxoglutarate dehydrogenase E1 component
MLERPEGFTPNQKLERLFRKTRGELDDEAGIDWAHAEALAFASLLEDGVPIRLTGQDTVRGTFSQRHAALYDAETGERYVPLQNIPQAKASFAVYNSPLSEIAVMGFEYGYSVNARDALTLWEAQYGDFANVAQPMIDQFIVSGQAKWSQTSGRRRRGGPTRSSGSSCAPARSTRSWSAASSGKRRWTPRWPA